MRDGTVVRDPDNQIGQRRRATAVRCRALAALAIPAVLLSALAGCVSVPTTGPVERIEGKAPACQNCVNVKVAPPVPGQDPKQIVQGYLRATSNYQPNYGTAKKFLTKAAAEKWSPEDGAQVYRGSLVTSGISTVVLDGQRTATIAADRTYSAQNVPLKVKFRVVKEDGEWRIVTPPKGLLVTQYSFENFYKSYNVYFVGNGASLVPDPIYVPLPNQANIASVLMKALLTGPSDWLKPAVVNEFPANTTLSVDSVTIQNGVAQVPLSDTVLALNDDQRRLLADQVVYTLQQVSGVESVALTVNQQPFRVPGTEPGSVQLPIDSVPSELEPVPSVAGDQLYAVRDQRVQLVDTSAGSASAQPVGGPLGQGKYDVASLAVSATNTDIAVVTDHRSVLRRSPTAGSTGRLTTLLSGATNLLRPQFSRYNELWAIGRQGGRQRMWVFTGKAKTEVGAEVLAGGEVKAFRMSPDGVKLAMVRTVGRRTELGIARINRFDKVTVDGWRSLDVNQSKTDSLKQFTDVSWLDATNMLVLGATTSKATMLPYLISEDASQIDSQGGESNHWDADEVAVLLGAQTAVVVDRKGRVYKDDGDQWLAFLDKCTTVAFPG